MSIQDVRQKINTLIAWNQVFWTLTIFGLASLIFGLLSLVLQAKTSEGIEITAFDGPVFNESALESADSGTVHASKSGTRYYYEDCAGLKRIKPENRVAFASAALAEQAGYTKAANCH